MNDEYPGPGEQANPEPEPMKEIEVDLLDSGLVWLFNTTTLHPMGLALGVDSKTGKITLIEYEKHGPVVFYERAAHQGWVKWQRTLARIRPGWRHR